MSSTKLISSYSLININFFSLRPHVTFSNFLLFFFAILIGWCENGKKYYMCEGEILFNNLWNISSHYLSSHIYIHTDKEKDSTYFQSFIVRVLSFFFFLYPSEKNESISSFSFYFLPKKLVSLILFLVLFSTDCEKGNERRSRGIFFFFYFFPWLLREIFIFVTLCKRKLYEVSLLPFIAFSTLIAMLKVSSSSFSISIRSESLSRPLTGDYVKLFPLEIGRKKV